MNKQDIINYAKSIGANNCGVAPFKNYDELMPVLQKRGEVPFVRKDINQRINPFMLMAEGQSIIVCLFPYMKGDASGVAKYAKNGDYHPYVKEKLNEICKYIGTGYKYKLLVDTGTLCDRYLAYLAGLGFYGLNNLLYADGIGSRFYIGSILTDLKLEADKPVNKTCQMCKKCISNCIGGALGENYSFDFAKCASYLTQTKQELSKQQQKIIEKSGLTLGCDICADVCPLNGEEYAD